MQTKVRKLATMAMLVAISIVLVYLIHFPIFQALPSWSMTRPISRS